MRDSIHYLLDTNAISAMRRRQGTPKVDEFFESLQASDLFLSVLTVGELWKGVVNRRRKDVIGGLALEAWVIQVEAKFEERILRVDRRIATLWGELSADRSRPAVDTLLAATAIVHGLTLVTRNTKDVADLPVKLLNPWQG